MFQKAIIGLIFILMPILTQATTDLGKPYKTITDASINTGGYLLLHSDTNWVIDGFVYVEDGAVLEVEAGTVVKANPGQGGGASALIIARGGYLKAVGTEMNPIIFTSIRDTVSDIYDIDLFDPDSSRGLWGGLILLGNATISEPNGVDSIEGIPGDIQSRHFYGGGVASNDNDSSCNLQYVSVRHGGTDIGAANEINGITMGGLGCKSIISHVEVVFNNDDGFEFFGGCPNTDHLAVAFCKDDSYDYDQGYRGTGQFWFGLQTENAGDHGGEHDGGDDSPGLLPYATPVISNVTYLGRGVNAATSTYTFIFRDNAGGAYYNSIFADWSGHGVTLDVNHSPNDSKDRMTNLGTVADLKIYNNYWDDMATGSNATALCNGDVEVKAYLFGGEAGYPSIPGWNNSITNVGIAYGSRTPYAYDLYPVPTTGISAFTWANPTNADTVIGYHPEMGATVPPDSIQLSACWGDLEVVDYPGAFNPNEELWIKGWTALDKYGYLDPDPVISCCQLRGDVAVPEDGSILVNDIVYMVNYLFKGGPAPSCQPEGDAAIPTDDQILVNDIVWMVNFLFKGGPAPAGC